MVAKMKFKDGFLVPQHHHVHEQITQLISGQMRIWFGANKEEVMDMYPGDVVVIPSNLPHEVLMIGDVEEVDTWAPPRQDWLDKTDDYLIAMPEIEPRTVQGTAEDIEGANCTKSG